METPVPLDLVLLHAAIHMDFLESDDEDDRGQASGGYRTLCPPAYTGEKHVVYLWHFPNTEKSCTGLNVSACLFLFLSTRGRVVGGFSKQLQNLPFRHAVKHACVQHLHKQLDAISKPFNDEVGRVRC